MSFCTFLYRYLYPFEAFEDLGTDTITEHEESPMPEVETKPSPKAADSKKPLVVDNEDTPSETGSQTDGDSCTVKEEKEETGQLPDCYSICQSASQSFHVSCSFILLFSDIFINVLSI